MTAIATLVYLPDTTPPGEAKLGYYQRKAGERAKTIATRDAELVRQRELLEAAYDLIARHHKPAEPCRADAIDDVQERYEARPCGQTTGGES